MVAEAAIEPRVALWQSFPNYAKSNVFGELKEGMAALA